MRILITGGTGLIGRALCHALRADGHHLIVLSRRPETVERRCGAGVEAWGSLNQWQPSTCVDAVINLAGEPIADRRWSPAQKQRLLGSRVGLTEELVQCIARAQHPPQVLLSGSAIGIYGDQPDSRLDESAATADDFAARLCSRWEAAALKAQALGVRTVILRTGLVLDAGGGLLKKMLPPFRWGMGAVLGRGTQWMSWIHRQDYVRIVMRLLTDAAAEGPYNLTAPFPVTHEQFTRELARTLRRLCLFRAPARVLQTLLGERAALILGGQNVVPVRVLQSGYAFEYPRLAPALQALLRAHDHAMKTH